MDGHDTMTNERVRDGSRGARPVLAQVDDLHLHFDTERGVVKALDGVSFEIYEGETLVLVGETGCGKTITARSFMQLVPTPPGRYPSGRIRLRSDEPCRSCGGDGCADCFDTGRAFENVLDKSKKEMQRIRGKKMAMVFQDPDTALNPSMRILEQVSESILAHQADEVLEKAGVDLDAFDPISYRLLRSRVSTDRSLVKSVLTSSPPLRKHKEEIERVIRDRVVDVLRETNIPNPQEVIKKYPHELSGGMKQRVMIATALVSEPDLLIADEPTTALDVTTQARILDMLQDLQEKHNTALLYITHDLSLVEDIADRVAVMYAGVIAEIGGVEQLYDNPLHPYTWGLMDSIPSEERVGQRLQGIGGSIPDMTRPPSGCRFCPRCPEVMDHCCDVDPPVVEEEEGHVVVCHLYPQDESAANGARVIETGGKNA